MNRFPSGFGKHEKPNKRQPKLAMKTILICASIVSMITTAANAQNADILWQTPTTISGPLDVNTFGSLFGTWAPFDGAASSGLTVNGVTFQAFPDLHGATTTLDNGAGNGTFASPNTSDNNYNTLLTAGAFGNNPTSYTISWNGMTPGDHYLVELWVNDGRNSTVNARTETITGGANTSLALDYGSGSSGPGQDIIGTFVADSSGSETLTLAPGAASPSAQFNLLEVRDITPVPEPSTLSFLIVGAGATVLVFRRKRGVNTGRPNR